MTEVIGDTFTDHKFATKHGVPLWLRVWPTPLTSDEYPRKRSWFLWIHGGGYRGGNHFVIPPFLLHLLHHRGYHVVSASYRLAPYVTMEDMIEDCYDAWAWCTDNLDEAMRGHGGCNTNLYAIGGSSAGGGLCTMLGFRLARNPPFTILCVNGSVDLAILSTLQAEKLASNGPWSGSVPEEEMAKMLQDHDPSHAVTYCSMIEDMAALDESDRAKGPNGVSKGVKRIWQVPDEAWTNDHRSMMQSEVNKYIGHKQGLVDVPLRLTPNMAPEDRRRLLEAYSPHYLLDTVKVYPPTVFLHGTKDVIVPVSSSKEMAKKLEGMNIAVKELYIPGGGHGCMRPFKNTSIPGWNEYIEPIGTFLDHHISMKV